MNVTANYHNTITCLELACYRLRDSGEKSFSRKKCEKRVKTTHQYGVKLTPFSELFLLTPDWKKLKELFFRSNNDPKFGVELGVKVTP